MSRTNATIAQFGDAAKTAASKQGPAGVNGGVVGAAAAEASASATQSVPLPSTTKSAGVEARGGVAWVLVGLTGVVAGVFGGLIL